MASATSDICPHCRAEFSGWVPHPNRLPEADPALDEVPDRTEPFLAPFAATLRAVASLPSGPSVKVVATYTDSPWVYLPSEIADELGIDKNASREDRLVHVEIEGQSAVMPFDLWRPPRVAIGRSLKWFTEPPHSEQSFVLGPSESSAADAARVYHRARAAKEQSVLVLGEDTSRLPVLRDIQGWLRDHDYSSVIVKDLADIEQQSVEEKVLLLASLSRFIVCDDATASGHIDELRILTGARLPTVILNPAGSGGTWMQADYEHDYSFMRRFEYRSSPRDALHGACRWAEQSIIDRRKYLNGRYPWR